MFEKRIQVRQDQELALVDMAGDVRLTSWDEVDVLLRLRDGQEQDVTIEETETGPAVSARVGCQVMVPTGLPVKIRQARANLKVAGISGLDAEQVRGNLKLNEVSQAVVAEVYGNLKAGATPSLRLVGTVYGDTDLDSVQSVDLQNVRGNLRVRGANRLRASRVSGNLQVKGIAATLEVGEVGGNATLEGIGAALILDQVAGNLAAKHLAGGARVPKIGGNLVLNGEIGTGCTYQFNARGNALLRLPEGAGAHLRLSAKGKLLSSRALSDERREGNTLIGTLGDGGAEMVVDAAGNIVLGGGRAETGAELGEEISRQIEEGLRAIDLETIGRQVGTELDAALSRLQVKLEAVDWERVGVETQRAVERAMAQMQRNMDRMVDKAARHQERLERRLEREGRRMDDWERRRRASAEPSVEVDAELPNWPAAQDYEPADVGPHLDEERLSILRMVEQGQITPEEAEMLLDALE